VPAAATAAAMPEMPAGAKPGSKNYVPPAPPAGKLTRERFAATQEWLRIAPGDQYSIQLLTAGLHDLRRIEELLARAEGRNLSLSDFYVYGVKIDEQQHYRLAHGLYPTLADANQGIKGLPPVYRQFAPYQRSVARMRSQNRQ
jgi:septal ring-binding cell division protein DamX